MSTKESIKYHRDEQDGGWFHLYRDCFDEQDKFVYLELGGIPFEASTSADLSGNGLSRVAVRLPNGWAIRLGLVDERPETQSGNAGEKQC